MQQPGLFDVNVPAPIKFPVDPDGRVVPDPLEVLSLPNPKMPEGSRIAEIEVHPAPNYPLWMWATHFQGNGRSFGYRVGVKWGKFALGREAAIYWGICELAGRLREIRDPCPLGRKALNWLESLSADFNFPSIYNGR